MIHIGIDIGFSGAIAILVRGEIQYAEDMPVVKIGKKKELNLAQIRKIIRIYDTDNTCVYIEKAQAMPHQGCVSMFRYGKSAGLIEGIVSALEIPYTLVTPQAWKREMMAGMSKEKGASILRVNELYPDCNVGTREKDHGICDAILIAAYGRIKAGAEKK